MIRRFNVCFDIDIGIDDAVCSSVEEQVCIKAIEQELSKLGSSGSLDVDNHFVDIKAVDNITVESYE